LSTLLSVFQKSHSPHNPLLLLVETRAARAVSTGNSTKLLVTTAIIFAPRTGVTYGMCAMSSTRTGTSTVMLALELRQRIHLKEIEWEREVEHKGQSNPQRGSKDAFSRKTTSQQQSTNPSSNHPLHPSLSTFTKKKYHSQTALANSVKT
jgi:hypothetical protein